MRYAVSCTRVIPGLSLWLTDEGGYEDGGGLIYYLTNVLVHVDRNFEDFPSPANPSPGPRSGPIVNFLFAGVPCITVVL